MLAERVREIKINLELGLAVLTKDGCEITAQTLIKTAIGQVERLQEVTGIE